jgi:phytoene dehydrogenase-like protein
MQLYFVIPHHLTDTHLNTPHTNPQHRSSSKTSKFPVMANMSDPQDTTSPSARANFLHLSAELADLGQARFDHDTAEATDRDAALFSHQPIAVRQGRAPKGLENKVFAWNTFKYTTDERDDREELKGELHEGQLHRQNRAAREPEGFAVQGGRFGGGARGGSEMKGGGGGRGAGNGGLERYDSRADALCAGRMQGNTPPLAKGYAEELSKDMFWDEPIV